MGVAACNPPPAGDVTATVTAAPGAPVGEGTATFSDGTTITGTIPVHPDGTPTIVPSATCTLTPSPTPTQTPYVAPWKTDPNYDPYTNSIPNWGSDNSETGRLIRAEKVYDWLRRSGGYWSSGAPNQDTLTAWLVFEEGSILDATSQENMAKGIRYRFNRWGYNDKQRSAFTAFINPQRDNKFDENDWKQLTAPNADIAYYEGIVTKINRNPVAANDGKYLYWFDQDEMIGAQVSVADIKRIGEYSMTTTAAGVTFYFTGNIDVHRCATQGRNACDP